MNHNFVSRNLQNIMTPNGRKNKARRLDRRKQLAFFAGELEKRQLLAAFTFDEVTGILAIEADNDSETLSIEATSNSGDYQVQSNFNFSGSDSTGNVSGSGGLTLTLSGSNITSIEFTNNPANSGTSLFFGNSTGNFTTPVSINFDDATNGNITIANDTLFDNVDLTACTTNGEIQVSSNLTVGTAGFLTLTANGISISGNVVSDESITINSNALDLTGNLTSVLGDVSITSGVSMDLGTETAGKFSLTDSEINRIHAGGLISLTSTTLGLDGSIDVTEPINTTGNLLLFPDLGVAATGNGSMSVAGLTEIYSLLGDDIRLDTNPNLFNCLTINNFGFDIYVAEADSITLGAITANNFTLDASGNVIQLADGSSAIVISNIANITSTGNIVVDNSGNDLVSISANGTDVRIVDSVSDLELIIIQASNLTVISSGNLTQSGPVDVGSGTSNFATTGCITLENSTNQFGTLLASGTEVSITDQDGVVLGTTLASNLTLNASGAITQSGGANVSGTSNFISTSTIVLNQISNDLGDVISNGILNVTHGTLNSLTAVAGNVSISGGTVVNPMTMSVNFTFSGGNANGLTITGGISNLTGGTFTGEANVVDGQLISNISLGSLSIGANGTANLTGGSVGSTINLGSLELTAGSLSSLSSAGETRLSGGSVTGLTNITGGNLTSSASLGNISISNGVANLTGGSANIVAISGGRLTANALLGDVEIQAGNLSLTGGSASSLHQTGGAVVSSATISGNAILEDGTTEFSSTSRVNGTTQVNDLANLVSAGTLNILSLNLGTTNLANLTAGNVISITNNGGRLFSSANLSGNLIINAGESTILSGGQVHGSTNVTSGSFSSNGTLTTFEIGAGGAATISGGNIGETINSGTLIATGGTFDSIYSSNITSLTGATVTGLSNITGGTFTANATLGNVSINGGDANLTDGSANAVTLNSGNLVSAADLTSLTVQTPDQSNHTANITGGTISGDISLNGGYLILGGTQQGNLTIDGAPSAAVINTAITGLTTVTNSCQTNVNANLTGGLTIDASTGAVNFNPNTVIGVGATTISGNVTQTIPANTTLASLDQSNGTVSLDGTLTALANITGGTLNSAGQIGSLTVGASGTANLTSGNVTGATVVYGCLTVGSSAGINTLVVNNGTSAVAGNLGSDASINDGSLTLVNGSTAAGNVSVNHGNLYANGTIGNLYVGTLGGNAEVLSGGVVQGTTNVTATGSLVSAGSLQALNVLGANSTGTANLTGGSATTTVVSGSAGLTVGSVTLTSLTLNDSSTANVSYGANVIGQTIVNDSACLTTNGTLSGGLTVNGGTINTYSNGTTTTSSSLNLGTSSIWVADGSALQADGSISANSVSIGSGANLTLGSNFSLAGGATYTLINNTGSDPISGTFTGLPEGSILSTTSGSVVLTYSGGTGGNDVVIYSVALLSTEVDTNLDVSDSTDGRTSLREAIYYAGLKSQSTGDPQTITFNTTSLFNSTNANTIALSNAVGYGILSVNQNGSLSIIGPSSGGQNRLTVSGNGTTGIFQLFSNTTISNLTLSEGNAANGGAIWNNATTSLTNVTVMDNNATDGAGIYNAVNGELTITSSTFANNTASTNGGAIDNNGGNVTLISTTIAYNSAANGGGINNIGGNVSLLNTIVADNTGTTGPDVKGSILANYSLISNATGAGISGSNNLANVTALLGTLDYYSGTTKVFPLLPGSPAIDSGTAVGTPAVDQRGCGTIGTSPDMGSFESQGFDITGGNSTLQVAMIGTSFPANLTLNIASRANNEPVAGGVITFTFANETGGGNSANGTGFTPTTAVINGLTATTGNISVTATANNQYDTSNYTALANATGANAAASYLLKNVGLPDSVTIVGNNNQTLGFNSNFTPFTVTVKDSLDNVIPRANVVFSSNSTAYGATANLASNTSCNTYSALTDDSGNVTSVVFQSNNIGGSYGLTANAVDGTATNTYRLTNLELSVQNGYNGRSFVNNVAGVFGNTTLATDLVSANRVQVQYLGYSGTETPTNVTLANGTAGSGNITWNYGSAGITGDPNSAIGDGVYRLAVDYNGDGNWTYVNFHRLFGDVNGDKVVDTLDYRLVLGRNVFGRYGIQTGEDTNGAGRVFSKDITNTLRQRGRRVSFNKYNS